ncbi:uncharacterized protein LOC119192752 [Manduca sexta]|uniref:uncharacterized protein LOC119192752 n=1 Tax=Manduca sexta TaxID=7130 RepID=UPI00188DF5A8|nr:uncharacterized protein LOC119192752 [Manduca sexta]
MDDTSTKTDILRDDAIVEESESETNSSNLPIYDGDMQTNSRENSKIRIISNIDISGISSLVNVGDIERVSLSDLNLIEPMCFDQMIEDSPKLLCNHETAEPKTPPRKYRIRACHKFTKSRKIDSETDNQDFSSSDGSDFDPDSSNRSRDDSMSLVPLSDVIVNIIGTNNY